MKIDKDKLYDLIEFCIIEIRNQCDEETFYELCDKIADILTEEEKDEITEEIVLILNQR